MWWRTLSIPGRVPLTFSLRTRTLFFWTLRGCYVVVSISGKLYNTTNVVVSISGKLYNATSLLHVLRLCLKFGNEKHKLTFVNKRFKYNLLLNTCFLHGVIYSSGNCRHHGVGQESCYHPEYITS